MKRNALTSIALIFATLLIYGQVHYFDFVNYDDGPVVFENDSFKTGLSREGIRAVFHTVYLGNWIPVTGFTYHVDYELYDDVAGGMHISNAVFHVLNVLLLFGVMIRFTGGYWPSFFCALLFAVHPLHVESVAWVSERKDLACGFFFLATLWIYKSYTDRGSWWRYGLVLVFTGLALLAKPMAVTLPCVLLLLDYWPLDRISKPELRKCILEKIPMFLVVIVVSAVTIRLQSDGNAMTGMGELSFLVRIQNVLWSYGVYLGQTIMPIGLLPFYPHLGESLEWYKPVLCGVLLLFITVWVWKSRSTHGHRFTGWCWFLGMLVPVIGFIQVGGQSHADRYMYLPQIGLAVLAFWELERIGFYGRKNHTGLVILFLAFTSLGVAAFQQTSRWENSVTLFEHTLKYDDDNPVGLSGLSEYYVDNGDWDAAEPLLERMLVVHPRYGPSLLNFGKLHYARGDYDQAIRYYNRLLRYQPENEQALNNFGNAVFAQGRYEYAKQLYNKAIAIDPEISEAHSNLGAIFILTKSYEEARSSLEKSLSLNPNDEVAWVNLGVVYFNLGKRVDALEAARKAIEIDPEYDKGVAFLAFLEGSGVE